MINRISKKGITWYNLENPTQKDIANLKKVCPFHALDIEDIFSSVQRPKVKDYPEYLFLVFHFPIYNHQTRAIRTEEIDVFAGPNYLITIHAGRIFTLKKFFKDCQKSKRDEQRCFGRGSSYLLYQITKELLNRCFPMLDHVAKDIDRIEDNVFEGREKKMVREISIIYRNILNFRRIFKPQRQLLDTLAEHEHPLLNHKLSRYYQGLDTLGEKIWDILSNQLETIYAWQSTNNALISYKQSSMTQVITVFSFVAVPLLLLAQLYMRSAPTLPGEGSPLIIWLIVGGLLAFILSILVLFAKRRWL